MAPAGRDQVLGQAGRTAPVTGLGVPVPGAVVAAAAGPGSELAGCRE